MKTAKKWKIDKKKTAVSQYVMLQRTSGTNLSVFKTRNLPVLCAVHKLPLSQRVWYSLAMQIQYSIRMCGIDSV